MLMRLEPIVGDSSGVGLYRLHAAHSEEVGAILIDKR